MTQLMQPDRIASFRAVLAFGLATCEQLDVELYSIDVTRGVDGPSLRLFVDADDDRATVDRLAEALGVTAANRVEKETDTTFVVGSRMPRPSYFRADQPTPDHFGESVPFDGGRIGVQVMCALGRAS